MIASEHDTFEVMFDVIVNEVKKYWRNVRKLKAKADSPFEQRDAIGFVHVRTGHQLDLRSSKFNLQRLIHVKPVLTQRKPEAKRVELCQELLS